MAEAEGGGQTPEEIKRAKRQARRQLRHDKKRDVKMEKIIEVVPEWGDVIRGMTQEQRAALLQRLNRQGKGTGPNDKKKWRRSS